MKIPDTGLERLTRSPAEKWPGLLNPRFRARSPAKGRGRLQVQVARCFLAAETRVRTSSEVYAWCFVGRRRHRYSVWRILVKIADPVERVPPHGAWLWKLKQPIRVAKAVADDDF
jgi:hypothetical protein